MERRDFIHAEVRACTMAQHVAQLVNAIVDLKHTAATRGTEVYLEVVAEEIDTIRKTLADIEAGVGLVEKAEVA